MNPKDNSVSDSETAMILRDITSIFTDAIKHAENLRVRLAPALRSPVPVPTDCVAKAPESPDFPLGQELETIKRLGWTVSDILRDIHSRLAL